MKSFFLSLLGLSTVALYGAPPLLAPIEVACQVGVWDDAKHEHLATLAREQQAELLEGSGSYHYPFSLPVRYALERQQQETMPILAFGSLMSRESAARTLDSETIGTMRPAIAFGIKRLFNYNVPQSKGYGLPTTPQGRAMLNTETSWTTRDLVNGVVIDVPKEEILALCKRETGYDLVPVVTVDWHAALGCSEPQFYVTYALRAVDKPHLGKDYTDPTITPFAAYYDDVKQAAGEYGPEFQSLYMRSTYLADGTTTIDQWEQIHGH